MILDIIYGIKALIISILTFPARIINWIKSKIIAFKDFFFKPKHFNKDGKIK